MTNPDTIGIGDGKVVTRPRLRRADVPAYLLGHHGVTVAVKTLAKYATIGGGPAMVYFGRVPLYEPGELDRWAQARLSSPVASTSERGAA